MPKEDRLYSYVDLQCGWSWQHNKHNEPHEVVNRKVEVARQNAIDDYLITVMPPTHPVHKRIKYRKEI
jgi:hypothetical protein